MLDVAIHRASGLRGRRRHGLPARRRAGQQGGVGGAGLRGRLAHARTLLVDLRGVGAFDRPGLGALVGVLRSAHPGTGRVRVCADQPALVELLRAEGLDRLFPLVAEPSSLQPAAAPK